MTVQFCPITTNGLYISNYICLVKNRFCKVMPIPNSSCLGLSHSMNHFFPKSLDKKVRGINITEYQDITICFEYP